MIKNYESFLKEGRFNPFKKRPIDPEDLHHPPNDETPMLVPGEHAVVDPYGEEEWDENDFSFGYNFRKCNATNDVESLDFAYKNIETLNGIENCVNLKRLVLTNNNLTSLNGIENCVNLTYLNVSNNKLTNFDQLNDLIMLNNLVIDSQRGDEPITDVDFVRNLINLEILVCKGNMITNLDVIKDLPDLKILHCCPNDFSEEYAKELKDYCEQNGINNDLRNCLSKNRGGYKFYSGQGLYGSKYRSGVGRGKYYKSGGGWK